MSLDALFCRDDGTRDIAGEDSAWDLWVSASRTRNYLKDDPLLDWLDAHGMAKGFARDNESVGYDARTDFGRFVMVKGAAFESAVVSHLRATREVVTIAIDRSDARSRAAVTRTWKAMTAGIEIIAQAPIWNPQTRTYGVIDLLVRSDVLESIFPGSVGGDAQQAAPHVPGARWHYRVLDVKFSTLDLLKDGHAASGHLHYAAQVWLYNEALGRLQGLIPTSAYLLGRGWTTSNDRGQDSMERLSRVDHASVSKKNGPSLRDCALSACDWVRRVRADGARWNVMPRPSVPELRPNLRSTEDAPWHGAKRLIAEALEDLTILPRVNPDRRDAAMAGGLTGWRDPACNAASLGVRGPDHAGLVDAVIAANHSPADGPAVFPARVTVNEDRWRDPKQVEFFVDFETVSDLDDDFSTFPRKGAQALIFMIGCGYRARDGAWTFDVFTADRLVPDDERRILDAWLERMQARCAESNVQLADARIFHWSPAEVSTLQRAYNSAAARHQVPTWNSLPWFDLLRDVVRAQPVTVRGAFGFGLKAVTRAMHAARLIASNWPDGVADGLGAMVGAWWCDHKAKLAGGSMRSQDLMKQIEAYNRVDVEAMRDVLDWLRQNR